MAARRSRKIAAPLEQLLVKAEADAVPLDVVVRLRESASRTAEQTRAATRGLLDRVTAELAVEPDRFTVFEHLGYFALVAPVAYLRRVAAQPEVEKLSANRPSRPSR